jgi:diguanylate cyclase (GGDEF)-like protein
VLIYSAGAFTAGLSLTANGDFVHGVALALAGSLYAIYTATDPQPERGSGRRQLFISLLDVFLVSAFIWFTGGVASEYYLIYFVPVAVAAVRRDTAAGFLTCAGVAVLYPPVVWAAPDQDPVLPLVTIRIVTVLAGALMIALLFQFLREESKLSDDLRETLHNALRRVAAVYEVAHVANTDIDLAGVLTLILEHAQRASGAHTGAIFLLGEEGTLQQAAATTPAEAEAGDPSIFTLEQAAETLKQTHPRTDFVEGYAAVYLPISAPSRTLGVLAVAAKNTKKIPQRQLDLLNTICAEAALAIENALLRAELRRLAITDSLTGLANRREIERQLDLELDRAARYHRPLAVMMVDVDDLKEVNDRYGHGTGDDVLVVLSHLMQHTMRSLDVTGRIGGDEFAIVLPETATEEAAVLAERLVAGFHQALAADQELPDPIRIAQQVGVSIGIADRIEGETQAKELVSRADMALYNAKRLGKNRVAVATSATVQAVL